MIKTRLWLFCCLTVSLERIQLDGGDVDDNDNNEIMMKLHETFWATKLLTCVSNSNKDLPWFIQSFTQFLMPNTTIKSIICV